ncbi:MAG: HEAT repeat domain-containing protein [Microbacter sp.]
MTFYCTNCWHEIDPDIAVCPYCGANQYALSEEEYDEKLIRALHHPEPMTPIRAAFILGERGVHKAVPDLEKVILENKDPYLVKEALEALGKIGLQESETFLNHCLHMDIGILARKAGMDAIRRMHYNDAH